MQVEMLVRAPGDSAAQVAEAAKAAARSLQICDADPSRRIVNPVALRDRLIRSGRCLQCKRATQ